MNSSTDEYTGLQRDFIRSNPTVSLKCTRDIGVTSISENLSIIKLYRIFLLVLRSHIVSGIKT